MLLVLTGTLINKGNKKSVDVIWFSLLFDMAHDVIISTVIIIIITWVGGKERNLLASESDQPFVSLSLCSPTA